MSYKMQDEINRKIEIKKHRDEFQKSNQQKLYLGYEDPNPLPTKKKVDTTIKNETTYRFW